MADFTFPVLAVSAVTTSEHNPVVPLTARSTVVDRSTQTAAPVAIAPPVQPTAKAPRSKDDEYLTHLLYSFLNKYFGVPYRVPLEKGYSQVDWLKLTRGSSDLNTLGRGTPLRTDITLAEVRQHRTAEDAWMVLSGKVYNITPYLKFHPGGVDILLKAAGKDGTALFQKYHPWVNADALLEKCLIGKLAAAAPAAAAPVGGAASALEPQTQ